MAQFHGVGATHRFTDFRNKKIALPISRAVKNAGVGSALLDLLLGGLVELGGSALGLPFPTHNFSLGCQSPDFVQDARSRLEFEANPLQMAGPLIPGEFVPPQVLGRG